MFARLFGTNPPAEVGLATVCVQKASSMKFTMPRKARAPVDARPALAWPGHVVCGWAFF